MPVKDYNTDPDLNTQISGINIAEGCPPSGINNAIRQIMADMKAEQTTQAAKDKAQDTAIAGKLEKSGGTMTGELVTQVINQRLANFDVAAKPSAALYGNSIRFTDKNNKLFAILQPVQWSNGHNALRFILGKKDGSQGGGLTIDSNDGIIGLTVDGYDIITAKGGVLTGALQHKLSAIDTTAMNTTGQFEAPIEFIDKNGKFFGMLQAAKYDGGINVLRLVLAKKDAGQGATLALLQAPDGVASLMFEGDYVEAVKSNQNFSNGGNFFSFASGMKILTGYAALPSGSAEMTVSFDAPFTKPPVVIPIHTWDGKVICRCRNATTTSCSILATDYNGGCNWQRTTAFIAIGR